MGTARHLEALLCRLRPLLQADRTDVELIGAADDSVTLRLSGSCNQAGHGSLHLGLEGALRDQLPELGRIVIQCECPDSLGPPVPPPSSVVVGSSPRMQGLFAQLHLLQASDGPVLITGETGTGKEVTARLIHQASGRSRAPFVAVSCALYSETLIESELFGHERGAFTGAVGMRQGHLEAADGGTIFLDDIDDVPVSIQVKLLRVLQNHTLERVGGNRVIPVDVRFIAGTKRNLRRMVAEGTFRADLFYRLAVFPVALPPLRERVEDIPELTRFFLGRSCARRGRSVPTVSDAVSEAFRQYSWPGNVRELENTCEWITQTCDGDTIRISSVPPGLLLQAGVRPREASTVPTVSGAALVPISFEARIRDLEKSLLDWALEASSGNKSRAAELLQMKRSTLSDHLRRLGMVSRLEAPAPSISQ